jgi:hypothetical protein
VPIYKRIEHTPYYIYWIHDQPDNTIQNQEYNAKLIINNVITAYVGISVKCGLMVQVIQNYIYLFIYLLVYLFIYLIMLLAVLNVCT